MAQHFIQKLPNKILVKQRHLIDAFNTTRPSLSASDLARYRKAYSRFASKEKTAGESGTKRATLA